MDAEEALNKLKNIDPKTITSAMGMAEKLFGAQMTAMAKERLQNAEEIKELLGKLSTNDFSAIEKALSGNASEAGELEKKLKDMLGG